MVATLTEEPVVCGKDVWASTNQHGTVVFVTRLSRRMRRSPGSDRIERWTEGGAEALLLTGAMLQSYEEELERRTRAAKDAALVNALLLAACLGFAATLMLAPQLSDTLIQPILAVILAAAGGIGLLLSRARPRR